MTPVEIRSAVWFKNDDGLDGKDRPGVVVFFSPNDPPYTHAYVVYGTGTSRSDPCVPVPSTSPLGYVLGLSKKTFFYASALRRVPLSKLRPTGKRCPPTPFADLQAQAKSNLHHCVTLPA